MVSYHNPINLSLFISFLFFVSGKLGHGDTNRVFYPKVIRSGPFYSAGICVAVSNEHNHCTAEQIQSFPDEDPFNHCSLSPFSDLKHAVTKYSQLPNKPRGCVFFVANRYRWLDLTKIVLKQ